MIWGKDMPKSKQNILYEIIKGTKWFRPETINDLCEAFPQLNITWLLTGEGEMINNANKNAHLEDMIKSIFKENLDNLKSELKEFIKKELNSLDKV